MSRKTITRKINKKERIRREKDSIPWRYCLTTLACGLFLVIGFFGAARQHFSSIDYGIKNSKLRKQVQELESENRRLMLSKEIALSPGEIKKSAKQFGMVELSASNIEIFSTREEKSIPNEKTVKPLIARTVDVKPVAESANDKTAKTIKVESAGFGKDGKSLKNNESKSKQSLLTAK
ncbi:MAG: hypothetical protein ABIP06_03425 [Pyrinomonadaceae bacterium]